MEINQDKLISETNQDRWNSVKNLQKAVEEVERQADAFSYRQLAELKRMCRGAYKLLAECDKRKRKESKKKPIVKVKKEK